MQKKLLFCLLLAATLSAPLAAQTPTYDISGTVTDAVTGEPLPGVFITYDKRGAQSDYNGRFQLRNVPAGHVALKTMYYSAYPMVTQEIDLRCDTTVHFRLTEQVTHLDEVVVTGTRTPKRLAESPVLTSVITTQEIQRAGSTSTMEVLTDNVPGLVSSSNAMGNNLRIRGLSSRYILFLVDGERMVSEGAGGNINFDQLDVNNIERVEMINGASSALYGSNAVGAVVNIITKKPVHDIEAGANLSWENHNTWRTRAEVGSNLERFITRASVFRNSSDGYNNSATGGNSSNPYTDYGANLNFGYRPTGRSDLNFTGRYYRHEVFNLPGTMNITHSLDHKMTVGANGGYRSADDRNNVRLSVNFDKYFAYDVIDATGENQRDKTAGYLSARLLDTFRPAERWELTGGAEYNYEDIFSASLFGDAPTTKTIQDANLFAQAEYDPIRNLDIIAGARYTYNDAFGSSFNPKLSVMYSVAGFNFRGGIGTAPMYQVARELAAAGVKPDVFFGFRDKPYCMEEYRSIANLVKVSTDTGAVGFHGFVTQLYDPADYDVVLVCGPTVMMKNAARLCAEKGTKCLVSLEKKMACGIGACLGCTCETKSGEGKSVCKNGPVFDAAEVF